MPATAWRRDRSMSQTGEPERSVAGVAAVRWEKGGQRMDRDGRGERPDMSGALHFLRDEFVDVLRAARTLEVRGERLSRAQRLEVAEEIARRAEQAIDALDEALSAPEKVARERPPVSPVAPTAQLVVAEVEDVARSRDVQVVVGVPSGLYAAMPIDALRQVVRNLLIDACRFAPPESVVQLRARRHGGDILVEVTHRSNGESPVVRLAGIDGPAESPEARPGVALTLKVVRALVETFGGATNVTARHGRVTFSVSLPSVGALGSVVRELDPAARATSAAR